MASIRTTTEVREALVDALRIDLVGPTNQHAFARELLPVSIGLSVLVRAGTQALDAKGALTRVIF